MIVKIIFYLIGTVIGLLGSIGVIKSLFYDTDKSDMQFCLYLITMGVGTMVCILMGISEYLSDIEEKIKC